MTNFWVFYVIVVLLIIAAFLTIRIGNWSMAESDYWYDIADQVRTDPSKDAEYRPLLEWAAANRPPLWKRLRWQSPEKRRTRANG